MSVTNNADVEPVAPPAHLSRKLFAGGIHLRLVFLTLAIIVTTTMIPMELRHPSLNFLDFSHSRGDVVTNVLLYMPLGFALAADWSFLACVITSIAISALAETLQFGYLNRDPSTYDLLANSAGGLLGALLGKAFTAATGMRWRTFFVPRWAAPFSILLAVLALLALQGHPISADFSNWDPTFHFALGAEVTRDRAWEGSISKVAIYSTALTPAAIRDGSGQPDGAPPLLEINSPDLTQVRGDVLLSGSEEEHLREALMNKGQMTLLVWFRTASLNQKGPSRIVTYSQDIFSRNFTLGQIDRTLNFRLRTPTTGWNGMDPALTTPPVLEVGKPTYVAAVYNGRISKLYVDGRLVTQVDLAANRPHIVSAANRVLPAFFYRRELEMTMGEVWIGGFLTLGVFCLLPSMVSRKGRLMTAVVTGVLSGLLLAVSTSSLETFGVRLITLCIFGGLVTAASTIAEPL